MKYLLIISLFFLLSCKKENDSISMQVNSNSVIHQTSIIPFEFLFFIPCTDEWVLFTGDYEIDLRQAVNNDRIHQGSQLQHKNTVGIGQTTGTEYKIIGQANDNGNYSEDGFTYSQHVRLTFSTPGAKNDWVVAYRVQVVTRDNEVVVVKSDFAEFCK